MTNVYAEHGYDNREAYLRNLAEEFGLETDTVFTIATLLGPSEDFDGLITSLEDLDGTYGDW